METPSGWAGLWMIWVCGIPSTKYANYIDVLNDKSGSTGGAEGRATIRYLQLEQDLTISQLLQSIEGA